MEFLILLIKFLLKKDQVGKVPFYKKEKAAEFLKDYFSDTDKSFLKVLYENRKDYFWFSDYHFSNGMSIRNALRENGYTEDYFGIDNLDYIYGLLMEMAIGVHEDKRDIPKIRKIRI